MVNRASHMSFTKKNTNNFHRTEHNDNDNHTFDNVYFACNIHRKEKTQTINPFYFLKLIYHL